jgi:hypothetical protein
VGECNQVSISVVAVIAAVVAVFIPKVRDESEDFGRDPVDWCNLVPPEPNQVEDLESVFLENVELKCNNHQPQSSCMNRSFA